MIRVLTGQDAHSFTLVYVSHKHGIPFSTMSRRICEHISQGKFRVKGKLIIADVPPDRVLSCANDDPEAVASLADEVVIIDHHLNVGPLRQATEVLAKSGVEVRIGTGADMMRWFKDLTGIEGEEEDRVMKYGILADQDSLGYCELKRRGEVDENDIKEAYALDHALRSTRIIEAIKLPVSKLTSDANYKRYEWTMKLYEQHVKQHEKFIVIKSEGSIKLVNPVAMMSLGFYSIRYKLIDWLLQRGWATHVAYITVKPNKVQELNVGKYSIFSRGQYALYLAGDSWLNCDERLKAFKLLEDYSDRIYGHQGLVILALDSHGEVGQILVKTRLRASLASSGRLQPGRLESSGISPEPLRLALSAH
jgi:hypothetical protein